jgi:cytidyltransferase-like protein
MSGISHLYDIYAKKGNDFISDLFNKYVTVNEKMDGSAFCFERDAETGEFKFYKRDQRNPITLVDRTLMKYYEKPINYIESLPPHIIENIPRGFRFGMEYFSSTKPVEIAYDRIPDNNLILSYVHKIENGKIKETIQKKEELDNWADLLGVERPPIIFQGYLSDEQKKKILEFVNTPFSDLVEEFKTKSFVTFIIGVLNPEIKKTTLNYDLEKAIEGVVFRFGSGENDSETVIAKMVDPVFTDMAKAKYAEKKERKPSDYLGIIVLDVMNFILEEGVDSFSTSGRTEDERYLSFMSDVFVKFLDRYSDKYKNSDFDEPEYLKKDEFRVNKAMVSNKEALAYMEEDDSFESLFKLIINQFRKIKKRSGGIISESVIEQFNMLVKDIEKRISKEDKKPINESEIPSFMSFKDLMRKKVDYITEESTEEEDDYTPEEDYKKGSFSDFITDLEKIRSTRVKNEAPLKEEEKGKEKLNPINIIVGRFQPFHKGHLNMAKELKEENGLSSIAVVIYPGHNKSKKSPFNEDLIKKYMEAVVRENPDYLSGFLIITRGLLGIAAGEIRRRGFEIRLIGAGDDRVDDYKKQVDFLKKAGKEFPEEAKVHKTKRSIEGAKIRQLIKNNDFTGFKKHVTPAVASLYSSLASALNESDQNINESYKFRLQEDKLDTLMSSFKKIGERLSSIDGNLSESDISSKRFKKILNKAKSTEFLLNRMVDPQSLPQSLSESLYMSFFGKTGKLSESESEYVEDFVSNLSEPTFEALSKISSGEYPEGYISITEAIETGTLNIAEMQSFNGINKEDLLEVYSMDSKFPSGRKRRGKGESLTAIAFGGKHYREIEADVMVEGVRIEVKTTMNSSLDTDSEPQKLNSAVSEAIDLFVSYMGADTELTEKKVQKKFYDSLISKLSSDGAKSRNSFISKFKKIMESKDIKDPSDIGAALICKQLDWYSESQGFEVLAIFVENDGFPEKLAILDGRNGFMTKKNFEILKESRISPRVVQGRMDIYNSNITLNTDED